MTETDEFKQKLGISYICIHCGKPVNELCKQYSSSVLKIKKCEFCNEVADKYIEFEPIIIVIDLILLSRPAYRHVLFNTDFRIHWKLSLVILLIEAYILWKEKLPLFENHYDGFSKEKLYYFCFTLVFIDSLMLLIFLRLFTTQKAHSDNSTLFNWQRTDSLRLVKAITLANVSKCFLLPIIIWNSHTNELAVKFNFILIMGYFMLALIRIYSVVSCCSYKWSASVVTFILTVKFVLYNAVEYYLKDIFL